MRTNYNLMSSLVTETNAQLGKRIEKLLRFNRRLHEESAIEQELSEWNLQLDNQLLEVPARQLAAKNIYFGGNMCVPADKGGWTRHVQNKCVISPKLSDWVFLITEKDKHLAPREKMEKT